MDHNFEEPLNMPPLQAIPPSPKKSGSVNLDDFIDDSEATPSDNRSDWEPSEEFEEETSNPSSSADATSDVDTSAAVERAIIAEITGELNIPVPHSTEQSGDDVPRDKEAAPSKKKKEQPCPYLPYFTNGANGLKAFVKKYRIPEDVTVALHPKGVELTYGPDHINVPLMAITEGGLRFPINEFVRTVLFSYRIAPDQLTSNSYRTINGALELKRRHGLAFTVGDLFGIYSMSRNKNYGRYFFATLPNKAPIIEALPDSDKWADIYVVVSGNFAPVENSDLLPVPTEKGDLAPGPITKRLKKLWSKEREDALRAIPVRDAPTVLNYQPTYRHFIKKSTRKRKGKGTKEQVVGASKKLKGSAISEEERAEIEELPAEKLRGKERHPVDRNSPDPFATESEMAPPKIDLAKVLAEQAAKRKKVVTPKPVSVKTAIAEEVLSAGGSKPDDPELSVPKSSTSRSKPVSGDDGPSKKKIRKEVSWEGVEFVDSLGSDMPREDDPHPFSPILINEEGDLLKDIDSIDANPRLAMSLLPAVALKRDLESVPKQLGENLFHLPYHLMKASQSMYVLYHQTLALNDQTRRYKTRADAALQKIEEAEKEADSARARVTDAERVLEEERSRHKQELERLQKEHEEKLQSLDTEAYSRGYLAAGKDYAQDIYKLVQKGKSEGRDEGFENGYLTGMDAAKIPEDDPRRKVPARLPFSDELSDDSPEEENQAEDEQPEVC